jgi:(hydroxyamino)benzene mutase
VASKYSSKIPTEIQLSCLNQRPVLDDPLNTAHFLELQGRRLLQVGVGLFLFTSFEGFAVEYLKFPRLGLSVHTLSALCGVMLLAFGLIWQKLRLGNVAARIALWLLVYSTLAIVAAYFLAAIWGAGNSTMPLAAGTAHGSATQESVIRVLGYSSAPTGIVSFGLILWGLRSD